MGDRAPKTSAARGWFHVIEPDAGRQAPAEATSRTKDGRLVSKLVHGHAARVEVEDVSEAALPVAGLLRVAAAAGHALESLGDGLERAVRVRLGAMGTQTRLTTGPDGVEVLELDGPRLAEASSHHVVRAQVLAALSEGAGHRSSPSQATPSAHGPEPPVARALFFESLMNATEEHNDRELSQGVLHMVSPLAGLQTEVVLVQLKMPLRPSDPELIGLAELERALAKGRVGLVCITLLEAYFDGVVRLIAELRRLGCQAHVAVGGVMPSLTPAQVAAHLPDVSFVCRGAGEVFVPQLCQLLGSSSVQDPFSLQQRDALLAMDGLIAIDRAGKRIISANDAATVRADDLDAVALDLSHIERHHLVHGVEISTSRGCLHSCTFCTITGRHSYQARSAAGVLALLERYQDRFRELFADEVPEGVFRLHFSDDDFACDRARAAALFARLRQTPFRLASCQLAISDLCRKERGKLLAEPDTDLLDAIVPDCFFDQQHAIARADHIADHGPRQWSAYLQIGVEAFNDAELARLGKGYRVAHVRAIVAALAERGLHMDAYLILSNVDTSAEQLVDGLEEVCRHKLRHPIHFHIKYPVTPYLLSLFPSASYRRHVRAGTTEMLETTRIARVAGYPEYDYPFVARDLPRDQWVAAAVGQDFFDGGGRYTNTLTALGRLWRLRLSVDSDDVLAAERLIRRLDDAPRRLVFERLSEVGLRPGQAPAQGSRAESQAEALQVAIEVLGPRASWLPAYRRHLLPGPSVVSLHVRQGADRGQLAATIGRCFDLLTSSGRPDLLLRLVTPELGLALELLDPWLDDARGRSQARGQQLEVMSCSSRIGAAELVRAAALDVHLELEDDAVEDSAKAAELVEASSVRCLVALGIAPSQLAALPARLTLFANLPAATLSLHLVENAHWDKPDLERLGECLKEIAQTGAKGRIDTGAPFRSAVAVDEQGRLFASLATTCTVPSAALLGHLDDLQNLDRYLLDNPRRPTTQADLVLASFLRWLASSA